MSIDGQTSLYDSVYKSEPGHFEVGKELHVDTYYYSKKYFQSLDNAQRVARMLADKIISVHPPDIPTTLVGYGNYSGLFLSNTIKYLKVFGGYQLWNYALIDRDDDDFSFSYKPDMNDNVIIVLPITCNYDRYFNIRKYIEKNLDHKTVSDQFFTVFLILHQYLIAELSKPGITSLKLDDIHNEKVKRLYKNYKWVIIEKEKVQIEAEKKGEFTFAYSLENYPAEIYLAEECELCFTDLEEKDTDPAKQQIPGTSSHDHPDRAHIANASVNNEQPLLSILRHHEGLNIIWSLPKFVSEGGAAARKRRFADMLYVSEETPVHIYGHLEAHQNNYLNYIHRDVFYQHNKTHIVDFFDKKLNKLGSLKNTDHIIVITLGHFHSSGFIEDLISKGTFGEKKVSIIPYHPFDEFLENFIYHYTATLNTEHTKIIYFDEVIGGGKSFKMISDYLKNTRIGGDPNELDKGFDLVLTLIDRTTKYSKEEINRKLATKNNPRATGKFIGYFKLNVPQIDVNHSGNPMQDKKRLLEAMWDASHLDALKVIAGTEILERSAKKIKALQNEHLKKGNLRFFPFFDISLDEPKNLEIFNYYTPKYNYQLHKLIKLELFHEISIWFDKKYNLDAKNFSEQFDDNDLIGLIAHLTARVKRNRFFNITEEKGRRCEDIEQSLITEFTIKILANPPFRDYKDIYDGIFKYNNIELVKILNEVYQICMEANGNVDIPFEKFRKLKNHIKRSVDLNSNVILGFDFLIKLKKIFSSVNEAELVTRYNNRINTMVANENEFQKRKRNNYIYQKDQIGTFKYFLLVCYKELVFNDPSRTIRLERLLNHIDLLPDGIKPYGQFDPDTLKQFPLDKVIRGSFYQLGRLLMSENIYLLNKLKEEQHEDNKFAEELLKAKFAPKIESAVTLTTTRLLFKTAYSELSQDLLTNTDKLYLDKLADDAETFKIIQKSIKKCGNNKKAIGQDIKEFILRKYYYYKHFDDNKNDSNISRQTKIFLTASKDAVNKNISERIKRSVVSMLYTLALLNTDRDQEQETEKVLLDIEINRILKAATSIIGEDLEHAFFIEYRDRQPTDKGSENIYSVLSENEDEHSKKKTTGEEHSIVKLDRDGLIYNMLYGLEDYPGGNVQTFIAVAKDDSGEVLALKDDYYRAKSVGNDAELKGRPNRLIVKDALKLDEQQHDTGLKMITEATMVLLFRLAYVNKIPGKDGNSYVVDGQAVLAICSKTKATTETFVEFANAEKMRLLLLIKEQLLDYLQRNFDNDAFISVIQTRNLNEQRKELNHGIINYRLALENQKKNLNAINYPGIKKNIAITNIIIDAITGQITAAIRRDETMISVTTEEFKERLIWLFEDKFLGNRAIDMSKVKLPQRFPLRINRSIYNIVIPEVIINMKKHSPSDIEPRGIMKIEYKNSMLTFTNTIGKIYEAQPKEQNHFGGKVMCKQIMRKLGLDIFAEPDTQQNTFIVKISLERNINR